MVVLEIFVNTLKGFTLVIFMQYQINAVLEADSDMISLSCAAHKLQLCVEEGLLIPTTSRAIGAVRKLSF